MRATVEIEDAKINVDGLPFATYLEREKARAVSEASVSRLDQMQRERSIIERAYVDLLGAMNAGGRPTQYPHCDDLVLHAPSKCQYCDEHWNWQAARIRLAIAFTGESTDRKRPCPATLLRSAETIHRWGGNRPDDVS